MTTKEQAEAPAGVPATTGLPDEVMALARTPQEKARIFELADTVAQARLIRRAASLVAATVWGASLSADGRAAMGRYCLEVGADPLRHVDLLGGQPFFNSDYYRDLIAANPAFDHDDAPVWIHDDPRLQADAMDGAMPEETRAAALKERLYRRAQRIARNVPEDSPACCIVRLHYKDRGPFEGVGEVHPGKVVNTRDPAKRQNDRDPIGLDNPRTTAEARAWREAGEKAEPVWFRHHPRVRAVEVELEALKDAGALREAPRAPELPPAPVVVPEGVEYVEGAGAAPPMGRVEPSPERMENHNPTALCAIDGPHPQSECGYHRKAGVK